MGWPLWPDHAQYPFSSKRIARNPGPMLFLVLLFVSLLACRQLIGGGALAGGALLPAPADASDLWARYLDGWHPVGAGGAQSAPPYLALVALLASTLLGSTGLAVTVLLVGSVPLAGFAAYFASRPLVESRLLRAWASVVYAFLPAATGALAGGHIGTAVLAILLPLIARAGIAASGLANGSRARGSWRATWAYALLLTFTTAFTPIVWPIAWSSRNSRHDITSEWHPTHAVVAKKIPEIPHSFSTGAAILNCD